MGVDFITPVPDGPVVASYEGKTFHWGIARGELASIVPTAR